MLKILQARLQQYVNRELSDVQAGFRIGFLGSSAGKESAFNAGDPGLIPGLEMFPWGKAWQPTPVFLPGESA